MNGPNFYNIEIFPELSRLKEDVNNIREEVLKLHWSKFVDWPEKDLYLTSKTFSWKIYPFFGFDKWVENNCISCPIIYNHLKDFPGLRTAVLSKLGPKTVLKPHYGWSNLANQVFRCHLGIIVPDNCGIWVEGEKREQTESQILVFDDSRRHSGYNLSDTDRIVLLLDIERPSNYPKGISSVDLTDELIEFMKQY